MPKIRYEDCRIGPKNMQVVHQANVIIAKYAGMGFDLTLRQLFYQFVASDLLPNEQKEYKRLGRIISDARRAGLVDWDAITDRTRNLRGMSSWDNPESVITAAAHSFRYDPWQDQHYYVEVWFEKDALMGVFERAANMWRLPFFSCRGYASDSEVWGAAQRIKAMGKHHECVILHFGDHDPSGLDMTRDIGDRLELFGADVEVRRLALNYDQIEQYGPPPNPAKESDSRFQSYMNETGLTESWELDSMEPNVLAALVTDEVGELIQQAAWDESMEYEDLSRQQLRRISAHYDDVVAYTEEF